MKKRILSFLLCLCMALSLLPATTITASAREETVPITELWVGDTQVVKTENGTTTYPTTSGTDWSFDSATATLTLNEANITTLVHGTKIENVEKKITGPATLSLDEQMGHFALYCLGDLNVQVDGDSVIDASSYNDVFCYGMYIHGDLSVSGTAKLTARGFSSGITTYRNSDVADDPSANLTVSGDVILSGEATATALSNGGASVYGALDVSGNARFYGTGSETVTLGRYSTGMYVAEGITVRDNAEVRGHGQKAKGGTGVSCSSGNIAIESGASLYAICDKSSDEDSTQSYGLTAGNYGNGQITVEGTLVASCGDATDKGYASAIMLKGPNIVVSGNGSVRAECGAASTGGASAYGLNASGNSTITVNGGGFLASGGTCAVNPATTVININDTPVFYEVSTNMDGSDATICADTDEWNSTYNGNFGAYKYINATTVYDVYINGTQITRVNRDDVLGDGTVSYAPAADGSPAQLTLNGASLTTVQLDGDTGLVLTGANTIGSVETTGAVTVSGSGGLTVAGSLDCGSAGLTVENGAALTTKGTTTANTVVNNGTLVNDGALMLPGTTTAEQIQAMNLTGGGVVKAGDKFYVDGIFYADGGDFSTTSLDLYNNAPAQSTYYKAGDGYILFTPAQGDASAELLLHNASIDVQGTDVAELIQLPAGTVTMRVSGENKLSASAENAVGVISDKYNPTKLTITSSDHGTLEISATGTESAYALGGPDGVLASLTVGGNVFVTAAASGQYAFGTTLDGNLTVETGAKFTARGDTLDLNVFDDPFTIQNFSGVAGFSSEESYGAEFDIYGACNLPGILSATSVGPFSYQGNTYDISLIVTSGSTLTIPVGKTLTVNDLSDLTDNGTIVNNGTLSLPSGTSTDTIKLLKLTGTGVVKVDSNYYTNGGVALTEISGGLSLTSAGDDTKSVVQDGYSWDGNTLTLGNAYVSGGLILPDNATIKTTSSSIISGSITGPGGISMHLTFTGTAPLSINGGISLGSDGDTVAVQSGAHVSVSGSFSLGEGGDGILNVTGSGTTLSVSSLIDYAVMCGAVNVQNGASLTAHSEGSYALQALTDGVSVTGGSTLTVGCDYGVYVKGGSFTIDESSTFTANAAVAAICVVDTTQGQALNVPLSMLPSGTIITSVVGSTHTYWTIANSASTLTANEGSDPATLTGALGALTLKKTSTPIGGGDGSVSSYTLTFATNGGSAVDKLSKTSGTVIDLSGYKPTRTGYTFAGWYSDTALTNKITGITLTKNTTVYAKWNEKGASPFIDVTGSAYYHDAVLWAVEKNVTSGTSDTAFSPDMICTRAQAVTFLWRTEGSPEPTSANCPFTDISKDDYYYKAVLWAVEKGITKGTSTTTFSPSNTVTRSQSMTFLWRAAGETTSASANPFADVSRDAYYYHAVLWAVEKDITKGTSAAAFSPYGGCTRAQIVTFLYRYTGK